MKWLAVLLTICCLFACSGDEEQQTIRLKRIDLSYGRIGNSYADYEYLIGPVNGVVTLHETAGKNLRIITHIENTVSIQSQHLLMIDDEEEVEQVYHFDPTLKPTGENQAWSGGWDIFIVNGELAIGEFELCVWVEGTDGTTSDVECFEFEVLEGEGKLKLKNLNLKRIK